MTRDEFEVLMCADGWTAEQRQKWRGYTPVCDRSTLYREMAKPDGVIEVQKIGACLMPKKDHALFAAAVFVCAIWAALSLIDAVAKVAH